MQCVPYLCGDSQVWPLGGGIVYYILCTSDVFFQEFVQDIVCSIWSDLHDCTVLHLF